MGVPNAAVVARGDPATRAAVRSAVLERFTRLIAGADSATRTLAAWCGEPPTTRIHTHEEAATLPEEALLLGLPPTTMVQRRHITHRRRDGTVLCEARAVVWLDSPAVPGPVVARLRTGPQPLGELLGRLGMRAVHAWQQPAARLQPAAGVRRPGPSGAGGVGRAGGRGRAGGPGQGDLSRARAVVTAPALPVESQCLEIAL